MLALSLLSLATLAAASPIEQYAKALEGRAAVTQQSLDNFEFYVQHSGAAYCNVNPSPGARITCGDNVCPDVQANAVTVVAGFSGLVTGISGYVATDNARKEIVLSIRGSNNVRNFITDVVFAWTDCTLVSGCKLHKGFKAAWDEISVAAKNAITKASAANPGYRVVATGHSLGGAVATIASAYLGQAGLKVDTYTYGSPRVGNDKFADFISSTGAAEYRVTHTDDPVPRLPPIIFGYRHTTPEYWLSADVSSTDYPLGDVLVCAGTANIQCNGGTFGLDIPAHLHYFMDDVSGCSPGGLTFKRTAEAGTFADGGKLDARATVSDDDLEQRLNSWSQMDQDYVNNS